MSKGIFKRLQGEQRLPSLLAIQISTTLHKNRATARSVRRVIVSHDPFLSREAALSGIIPTADSFWTLALVAPSVGRMVSGSALALECAGTRPRGPGTKKMRLKAGETSPCRARGAPEASNGRVIVSHDPFFSREARRWIPPP